VAQAVGDSGTVVYVDIDPAAVAKVAAKLKGVKNARAQVGRANDPLLAPGSLDAALIVFAYHEMTEHAAMLARIREALRPGGRLAVIEASTEKHRGESREKQVKEHELSPKIVEKELESAGFAVKTEALKEGEGVLRYLTVGLR
jgi:ubiquinone/menaquinone biosynthesis C-methylase UbiE